MSSEHDNNDKDVVGKVCVNLLKLVFCVVSIIAYVDNIYYKDVSTFNKAVENEFSTENLGL